jgi:predicted dehydrogenase
MKKSIGFIGCGETANFHAEALLSLGVNIQSVFAYSKNSNNIKNFAKKFNISNKYYDIEDMLNSEKLDALWIVVPWNMNYKILKRVRKYNIPIFIEKPIACSNKEIAELNKIYENFQHHFQVGYNRRFYNFIPMLKEQLKNEDIKSIIIEAPESSSEDSTFNDNMVHANSSHLIDLIYYLFNSLRLEKTFIKDDKNYTAVLSLKGDIPVHFISSWNIHSNFSIKINAKNRIFHLKPIEKLTIYNSMEVKSLSPGNNIRSYVPCIESEHFCDDKFKPGFLNQAKYFIESIDNRNCDDIAASLDSSTKVIKICEEIIGR